HWVVVVPVDTLWVEVETAPLPPPEDIPLSITSGCSGFMLSISFSTGIVGGGGAGGLAPVTSAPGVVMGIPEFEGRKLSGYLICGRAAPAGIGATISGVTITISSVFVLVLLMDWKNLPSTGTSPIKGIFEKVWVSRLSSNPPRSEERR